MAQKSVNLLQLQQIDPQIDMQTKSKNIISGQQVLLISFFYSSLKCCLITTLKFKDILYIIYFLHVTLMEYISNFSCSQSFVIRYLLYGDQDILYTLVIKT